MAKHQRGDLQQMQSLPLQAKIQMTYSRIRGWIDEYGEDGVYISFSGGKDSTVLLDLVRRKYPNIPAVFVNTGLEYPSVRNFAESQENVITLRPKMNFREVIIKYGYPVISKEVSKRVYEYRTTKSYRLKKMLLEMFEGTFKDHNGNISKFNNPKFYFLLNAPFKIGNKCCDVMKKKPAHDYHRQTDSLLLDSLHQKVDCDTSDGLIMDVMHLI